MLKRYTWQEFLKIFYKEKDPITTRKYVLYLKEALVGRSFYKNLEYFFQLRNQNPVLYQKIRGAFERMHPLLFNQLKLVEKYYHSNEKMLMTGTFDIRVIAYQSYLQDATVSLREKREILGLLQTNSPLVYCDVVYDLQKKQPKLLQELKEQPLPVSNDKELFAERMAYLAQERRIDEKKNLLSDVEVRDGLVVLSYMMQKLARQNPSLYKQIGQEFLKDKTIQETLKIIFDKSKTDVEKKHVLSALRVKNPLVYQQINLLVFYADPVMAKKFKLSPMGLKLEDIVYLKNQQTMRLYLNRNDVKLTQKQAFLSVLKQENLKLYQMLARDTTRYQPLLAKKMNIYVPQYRYSPLVKMDIRTCVLRLTQTGEKALSLTDKKNFIKELGEKDASFLNDLTLYLSKKEPKILTALSLDKKEQTDGVDLLVGEKKSSATSLKGRGGDTVYVQTKSQPSDGVKLETQKRDVSTSLAQAQQKEASPLQKVSEPVIPNRREIIKSPLIVKKQHE